MGKPTRFTVKGPVLLYSPPKLLVKLSFSSAHQSVGFWMVSGFLFLFSLKNGECLFFVEVLKAKVNG